MTLKMTVTRQGARNLLLFRQRVERELAQMAARAEKDALGMAIQGAQRGVYSTPEGGYDRTGLYLKSIYAAAKSTAGRVEVVVGDSAPYASYLEYGSLGAAIPEPQAEQLAQALGTKRAALYLGRSGKKWIKPNPAITRAALFAGLRMINRLTDVLERS